MMFAREHPCSTLVQTGGDPTKRSGASLCAWITTGAER